MCVCVCESGMDGICSFCWASLSRHSGQKGGSKRAALELWINSNGPIRVPNQPNHSAPFGSYLTNTIIVYQSRYRRHYRRFWEVWTCLPCADYNSFSTIIPHPLGPTSWCYCTPIIFKPLFVDSLFFSFSFFFVRFCIRFSIRIRSKSFQLLSIVEWISFMRDIPKFQSALSIVLLKFTHSNYSLLIKVLLVNKDW